MYILGMQVIKISLSMTRFKYRKDEASSHGGSLSRPTSFKDNQDVKKASQRVTSFKSSFDELNPFKVIFFWKTGKRNFTGSQ